MAKMIRLWCWYCHKPVSTPIPEDTIFRALAICPECIERADEIKYLTLPDDPEEVEVGGEEG